MTGCVVEAMDEEVAEVSEELAPSTCKNETPHAFVSVENSGHCSYPEWTVTSSNSSYGSTGCPDYFLVTPIFEPAGMLTPFAGIARPAVTPTTKATCEDTLVDVTVFQTWEGLCQTTIFGTVCPYETKVLGTKTVRGTWIVFPGEPGYCSITATAPGTTPTHRGDEPMIPGRVRYRVAGKAWRESTGNRVRVEVGVTNGTGPC